MLYWLLKKSVGIFFNMFNLLMGGNLPPFGCVSVIIEQQKRFLVIEQSNGALVFPGGFMRWHEDPVQTAKRECMEETGLHIQPDDILGYYSFVSNRLDRMSTLNIAYIAEVKSGELRESIEGKPRWVHEDELQRKIAPHFRNMLADYKDAHQKYTKEQSF